MPENNIEELLELMKQLRNPVNGCPWDLEQCFETIAPYTIEEAYEVAEAIQQKDMLSLKDELGDLLFNVVFHARLAEEQGSFVFDDVVRAICEKLVRRHPHVFSDKAAIPEDLSKSWEAIKRKEKGDVHIDSILDTVSAHQPAINEAYKLQKKASSVGFDWTDVAPVVEKLEEEIAELKHEMLATDNRQRMEEELGDVLFSCVNLARHLDINPEWSLRLANKRFSDRFSWIERHLEKSGKNMEDCSPDTLEILWVKAKKSLAEKSG